MVNLIRKNGEVVSFSIKGAGRFFKGLVQKAVVYVKEQVVKGFKFIHRKLADFENYLLKKIDSLGNNLLDWVEKKIDERFPEPEMTSGVILNI